MYKPSIHLVPYEDNPLTFTAKRIFNRFKNELPILNKVVILVPDPAVIPDLHDNLLCYFNENGMDAVLGLKILSIRDWVNQQPLKFPTLAPSERELILVEALQGHPDFFGDSDDWRLSSSLIQLFDELTLNQIQIPDSPDEFMETIRAGYDIPGDVSEYLSQESSFIHTLWKAWHQQLAEEGKIDLNLAYISRLKQMENNHPEPFFYFCGLSKLIQAEADWIKSLLINDGAELILHGEPSSNDYHPGTCIHKLIQKIGLECKQNNPQDKLNTQSQFIDAVYDYHSEPLYYRAKRLSEKIPDSPISEKIAIFEANNNEQEAQAISLQIRLWLLEEQSENESIKEPGTDKNDRIGIISGDRMLARRVRALLERSGIQLQDKGGWALSTTSAAATLERWIQCIEEDFSFRPLLDLLKSPFFFKEKDRDNFLYNVYRFEQDIILHENIPCGLQRYRDHLEYRKARLNWSTECTNNIFGLLNTLENASKPLLAIFNSNARNPEKFLSTLQKSLEILGIWQRYEEDPAGILILKLIAELRNALHNRSLKLNWPDFRLWLGRSLENTYFQSESNESIVQLINIEQTSLSHFDKLIIASAEYGSLPGRSGHSPYFNTSVRHELGLPIWQDNINQQFYYFRRLLQSASTTLITYRREQDGEEILPSPWVEAITSLHQIAYSHSLENKVLKRLIQTRNTEFFHKDRTITFQPAKQTFANIPPELFPETISAGSHQRLLDCPYLFFAADCLKLKPLDEIREILVKSDYGERIHHCLEAFHGGCDGLPGPFPEPVSKENRDEAIQYLNNISEQEFSIDIEDNFLHRGWLKRWQQLIPEYMDWQIEHQREWRNAAVEQSGSVLLNNLTTLKGRLDRVDKDKDGRVCIIDYKTGTTPKQSDIESGEAVQLPTYALIMDDVVRVDYLKLDTQKTGTAASLSGQELHSLKDEVKARLSRIVSEIRNGDPMPAWGDIRSCEYCAMEGLCRKQVLSINDSHESSDQSTLIKHLDNA